MPQQYSLMGISVSKSNNFFKSKIERVMLLIKFNFKSVFNKKIKEDNFYPYAEMFRFLSKPMNDFEKEIDFHRVDVHDTLEFTINLDDFEKALISLLKKSINFDVLTHVLNGDAIKLIFLFRHINNSVRLGFIIIDKSFFTENSLIELQNFYGKQI